MFTRFFKNFLEQTNLLFFFFVFYSGADVAGDEKREGEMSSCQNRRKFSSPASLLSPPLPPPAAQAQPRRFSNVGITARKFSQTLGWGGKVGAELTAEIVDQGRALCAQYIRSR